MLLTDGVMGWKISQHTHCAKLLSEHVISIITTKPFQAVKRFITKLKRVRRLHVGNWMLHTMKCFILLEGKCHIHTITLTSKVLLLAVYHSNQSSLNAAWCNLFIKRKTDTYWIKYAPPHTTERAAMGSSKPSEFHNCGHYEVCMGYAKWELKNWRCANASSGHRPPVQLLHTASAGTMIEYVWTL